VRLGQAPDGSLLLPLEKSRAGEESPAFVLEIFYLARLTAWSDKGKATLALPALDLPVSRTGLLLYHPPLFKLAAEPGAFRVETYEAPASSAFAELAAREFGPEYGRNAGSIVNVNGGAGFSVKGLTGRNNEQSTDGQNNNDNRIQAAKQALVDNFKSKALGGRGAKVLPIRPSFPAFGPSIFLVSELTAENHAPALEFNYQRDKKDGGK
jgi:hypothetical protein